MNARQQMIYDQMVELIKMGGNMSVSNSRLWEIYNDGMAEINRAKNYRNERKSVVEDCGDLDTFMGKSKRVELPYSRIVEEVLVPGRKGKPYTREELRSLIDRAKARGTKPDYEYYYYPQHYTDPEVLEAQRQWRKKAKETLVVSITAGATAAAAYFLGPEILAYLGTGAGTGAPQLAVAVAGGGTVAAEAGGASSLIGSLGVAGLVNSLVKQIKSGVEENAKGKEESKIKAGDKTGKGRTYTKHGADRANERNFDSQKIDNIIDNNYKTRKNKLIKKQEK